MKVLIVSDTHRRNDNYIKVLERVAPVDMGVIDLEPLPGVLDRRIW